MKKPFFKKVLSLILTICMLVSLSANLMMPASATTSDYMFYIDGSGGGSKQVMFRHDSHTSSGNPDWEFIPGKTYTFTARLKLESSDVAANEIHGKLFRLYYYNTSDSKTGIPLDSVTQSYDAEKLLYTAIFTVPSDCRNYSNTEIRIGDYGWSGYIYKIWIADMSLIAEGSTMDMMPAITSANSKVANSVSAENMYVRYNSNTYVSIQSKGNTFPELTPETPVEPEPVIDSDLVEFYALNNNYARLSYLKGWSTIKAGNYRFEMDCKIFSGTPTIRIGLDSTYGTANANLKNYTATYDEANYKYIITFSLSEDKACNLNVEIGNYGTDGLFGCANPALYLLDSNGKPTGSSMINTFKSEYFTTSDVNSERKDKWRKAGQSGNFTISSIPDGYFGSGTTEPEEPTISSDLIKITASGDWSCLRYTKGWSTIKAGNYRFEMDCKIFSGTPVIKVGTDGNSSTPAVIIDGYQSNYVATYDKENYKYIITFTMDKDFEGNLGVLVGNYGQADLAYFACANPTLYLLDANGNPTGNSLINTFSEENYSTDRAGNKWNRRNMAAGLFTCTNPIPEGYFAPGSSDVDDEYDYYLKPLDKGYVTFLFDDQRMPFTEECFDLFQSYGMPMCCDVVAGRVVESQEIIDMLLRVQEAGGEIFSHTYTHNVITSKNSTVENIEFEFGESYRLLTSLGFDINGIIETGNGGDEKTADYELMETIVRKYYKYSNAYGVSPQYKTNRTWLKNLGLDGAKAYVDSAIENKKAIILWMHDFSELSKSDMAELLSYIDSKGKENVEVVTWKYVYDNFANYTGPQVPTVEAIESVCASYGHNMKDATVIKEATCANKGEISGTCSICGKKVTEETEINPDNHIDNNNDYKCDSCDIYVGPKYVGDLNTDGKVNVCDLVKLKNIVAGLDDSDDISADLNNDNATDSLDITILIKFMLGVITEI